MTRSSLIALGLFGCLVALWFAIVPRPGEVVHATLPAGVTAQPAGASGATPALPVAPIIPHAVQRPPTTALAPPPMAAAPNGAGKPNHATDAQVARPQADGPIAELKASFAKEPRDSAAASVETTVESVFRQPGMPAQLFQHVLCRQTICKLELRWAKDRSAGYMAGMMRTFGSMGQEIAIEPLGVPDQAGEQAIDVYVQRRAQPKMNAK
jgi:hypothetical protein